MGWSNLEQMLWMPIGPSAKTELSRLANGSHEHEPQVRGYSAQQGEMDPVLWGTPLIQTEFTRRCLLPTETEMAARKSDWSFEERGRGKSPEGARASHAWAKIELQTKGSIERRENCALDLLNSGICCRRKSCYLFFHLLSKNRRKEEICEIMIKWNDEGINHERHGKNNEFEKLFQIKIPYT